MRNPTFSVATQSPPLRQCLAPSASLRAGSSGSARIEFSHSIGYLNGYNFPKHRDSVSRHNQLVHYHKRLLASSTTVSTHVSPNGVVRHNFLDFSGIFDIIETDDVMRET